MVVNFYNVEDQPVYYTVLAEECAFFNEVDETAMVGFLPVGTIYEIVDFIVDADEDTHWAKIQMVDGEYFVIITPDKCTIEEVPVKREEEQKDGIIKKIKTMFKKIFNKILK